AQYGVEIDTGASGNVIEGSYVGTDITGTASISNPVGLFIAAGGNTIGGTALGAGNVIAGNDGTGFFGAGSQVEISSSGSNLIAGNLIGLGASGHAIAGATGAGVWANFDASGLTIGGVTAPARNVISGNTTGIELEGGSNDVIEGNYV